MENLIYWAGFFGAWLLVIGPVFQATIELRAEGAELGRLRELGDTVPAPAAVSNWWLLLPPVWFVLNRIRSERYKRLVLDELSIAELEAVTAFMNKATGWLIVAGGGFLIASKETWELVHHNEWPAVIFWVMLGAMLLITPWFSAARTKASDDALKRHVA